MPRRRDSPASRPNRGHPPRWTRDTILSAIRRRGREGRSLLKTAIEPDLGGIVFAARRLFGTWRNAIERAGFGHALRPRDGNANRGERVWTRAELVRVLRRLEKNHGFAGTDAIEDVKRPGFMTLRWAIRREFGSITAAKKAAGVRTKRSWNRPRVLQALRALGRKRHPLTDPTVRRDAPGLVHAACRQYGTWRRALAEAGMR